MPTVTFSTTNGGVAISGTRNLGNAANAQKTTASVLYLRHDASNALTNVGFYLDEFSGTYTGGATAESDLSEVQAWGDATVANNFGGIQCNQDALGAFPEESWPLYNSHTRNYGVVCNTSQGSSTTNAVELSTRTGAQAAGELQAGGSPNVRLQLRAEVPNAEDKVGVRQIDLVMRYTYTS